MQRSPAFQSLTASALRVLLWCMFKNFKTATSVDHISGRPTFKLTNVEAKNELSLNQTTFSRAKQELDDKGFIEWIVRGGLKGCNGVASKFAMSSDWKKWSRPAKGNAKDHA